MVWRRIHKLLLLGQFIVATLIRATGIGPGIAYNLAAPTFFALTVAGAYTIVYNLAEGTRRALTAHRLPFGAPSGGHVRCEGPETSGYGPAEYRTDDNESRSGGGRVVWSPVVAGVGGALFVSVPQGQPGRRGTGGPGHLAHRGPGPAIWRVRLLAQHSHDASRPAGT